ncbi:MbnP family protein [uncultured Algibacter sp.]|uniref:MbnP family protein n=1 Tax=uncultured Algibacter sp. TaxID=298659 RepID=UPI0026108422|nr:MbnP family protein [uncultured Algibacter sp.]
MIKALTFTFICFISFYSCSEDKDDKVTQANITLNFNHSWNNTPVTNMGFNTVQFINENGEELSITKLRYLISRISLENTLGEKFTLNGYNLVDVTNNSNLSFTPTNTIPTGTYNKVSFIFGFNNEDNYNNNYQDLNSASWFVPTMLGGGYHYMQLEGKFIDNTETETGYAYHAIRAIDNSGTTPVFKDTFFEVNLGEITISNDTQLNINMNIAEWFKNPKTWDLNILNNMLMPNFDAQILMFENGQSVFKLKSINP